MTHELRYLMSPDVALSDHKDGVLFDPATGAETKATRERLMALTYFAEPKPRPGIDGNLDPAVAAEIDGLIEIGFIILETDSARVRQLTSALVHSDTTMFGCPSRNLEDIESGEFIFFGVPLDIGTTGYPGARYGPQAIRTASTERAGYALDPITQRLVGWECATLGGSVLRGARMADVGDVRYQPGEPHHLLYARIREVSAAIYQAGCFPIALGGDHSMTWSTLPDRRVTLLHIDAHSDLAEWPEAHCHHHGNVLTRLLSEGRLAGIEHIGLRAGTGADSARAGTRVHPASSLKVQGWDSGFVGQTTFVSLDIDVLDPSLAPGTGTPVVNGLSQADCIALLTRLATITHPVGFEVAEVNPMRDSTGQTERLAVELILVFLGALHARRMLSA